MSRNAGRCRLLWRVLSVGFAFGCLESFAPAGAKEFTPPDIYRTWWAEVEACAQLSGDFSRVEWYEVPGSRYDCSAYPTGCAGSWHPPHTIYVAQAWENDPRVVKHEMLHDLLQRGDHPPVFRTCDE